jgi:hypothetical protein
LDVAHCPVDDEYVIVVTSFQIFLVQIIPAKEPVDEYDSPAGAKICLSWRHFRNSEDIGLRLEVTRDEEKMFLFLYSCLNSLIMVFQIGLSADDVLVPQSVSDPFMLEVPPDAGQNGAVSGPFLNMSMISLPYIRKTSSILSGPGQLYHQHGVKFFQMFSLFADLSVRESLYSTGVPVSGWSGIVEGRFDPVQQPTSKLKGHLWSRKSSTRVSREGFVVPDGAEDEEWEGEFSGSDTESSINQSGLPNQALAMGAEPAENSMDLQWTVNSEDIYAAAFSPFEGGASASTNEGEGNVSGQPSSQQLQEYADGLLSLIEGKRDAVVPNVQSL